KKIVYEMRFDETTARYGEFGSFFVGHIINTNEFDQFFAIS
ncbi:chlorite dismutase family protein, partial [Staphylococcus aureus]|nr:chlorite dismutase family protein [Staphylococcus aureus]